MTIEISLVDLIFRSIVGICTITVLILILREQKKTTQFLNKDLKELVFEEDDELPQGEWVKMKDVQDVMTPMLRRFYNADDEDIECIIQEIEQKAYLIK